MLSGLAAVAFTRTLAVLDAWRTLLIERAHAYPAWGMIVPVLVGAAGAGLAVWLVRRFAPEASGSGIQQVEAVLHHGRSMRGLRILAVKFLGGVAVTPLIISAFIPGTEAIQLGGTSVLIVVSVVVETMKQLEAQMLMRHYEGFIR